MLVNRRPSDRVARMPNGDPLYMTVLADAVDWMHAEGQWRRITISGVYDAKAASKTCCPLTAYASVALDSCTTAAPSSSGITRPMSRSSTLNGAACKLSQPRRLQ